MFNNKMQLLCSNNLNLEMKKKIIESNIWSVALYVSETRTLKKWREGHKRILNLVLKKNVKNNVDR